MRNYKAVNVDTYIAGAPVSAQKTLKEIRKIIKSTVPQAEEGISWGVPFYKYYGLLGGFAVFKNHASFGLAFTLDKKIRSLLEKKGYVTGSKTIQIRFDQKAPTEEIRQILKTKAKINEKKKI